mgnify:FL=1
MKEDLIGIVIIPTMIAIILISILFTIDNTTKSIDKTINLMMEDSIAIDSNIINLGEDEDNHLDDTMYEVYPDGTTTKYY